MERLKRLLFDDAIQWGIIGLITCISWLYYVAAVSGGSMFRDGLLNWRLMLAVLAGVFAVGMFLRQAWARWVGMAFFVATLVYAICDLVREPSLPMVLVGLGCLMVLWQLWGLRMGPGEDEDEDEDEPFHSLVLLLREPRHLEATILAHLASKAWDTEVEASEGGEPDEEDTESDDETPEPGDEDREAAPDEDAGLTSTIAGESPHYLCVHWPGIFAIHHVNEPYFDEPEELAQQVAETRTRQAIEENGAWLSIDLIEWFDDDDEDGREAYRLMARFLAEVADDNCLAIVNRIEDWIAVYDPETEEKLRSDDPLEALSQRYHPPVVDFEADDGAMQAAVDEARRRWPEFVAAFENREPDPELPYSVKVPFTEGENTEFMWIEVTGIENDVIYGTLGNEPVNIPSLEIGDRVRAKVEELADWLYLAGDEPVGGFSIRTVADRLNDGPDDESNGTP